jgi:hypothetical protein
VDEATSWQTDDELLLLLETSKRRRRFQGFGSAYGVAQSAGEESQRGPSDQPQEPQPLKTVSGGAGSSRLRKKRGLVQDRALPGVALA